VYAVVNTGGCVTMQNTSMYCSLLVGECVIWCGYYCGYKCVLPQCKVV
jgi:hypothetical protein